MNDSQRLFNAPKIGLYCDAITHGTEKRNGDEVKIVTLALRVHPFDAKLATAVDDGLKPDGSVKATLFRLNDAEPKPILGRVELRLGCPRQLMKVFASSDTVEPTIAFDQVRIFGTYARSAKDQRGFAFVLKASMGPLGRRELEYVQDWHLSTRFVTFDAAEPMLDMVEDGATDADEKARKTPPAPMWDDETPATADAKREEGVRQRTVSHTTKRKAKGGKRSRSAEA